MRNLKKILAIVTVVSILGASGVVYAATSQTPAEIVAELTGKTVEDLYKERATGKSFGAIAEESGQLEAFKQLMLAQKKEVLDERVKAGTLTQEQADEIYKTLETNMLNCDGTGNTRNGNGCNKGLKGMGFGQGSGAGMRNGNGMGVGCSMNQ